MTEPFVVRLQVRNRGDFLSAVCADVPGLHTYGKSLEAVRRSAMDVIPRLLKANRQMNVSVSPMDDLTEIRVKPL